MCARGKVNHHSFISRPAFAQAHGLGPGCWPLPPRTTPFKIRVTYEIPTDCSLRAYLTGDAPSHVSYGSATPTTENGDTCFTLPNGSGTCELAISSPGVDSYSVIMLVLVDADGNSHYLSSQNINTVASIFEKTHYGKRVNPSMCVTNRPAIFKLYASANIAPDITWEATPSEGLVFDGNHGAVFTVTPVQTGTWTITANIPGYEGGMPSMRFEAVAETTTMVYAYILGTNGDYRTTAVVVTNLIVWLPLGCPPTSTDTHATYNLRIEV